MEKIFKDTLKHYVRMIKYSKSKKDNLLEYRTMEKDIGETWTGNYCPFCIKHRNVCGDCELSVGIRYYKTTSNCCGGLWVLMNMSKTWKEFTENAKKVYYFILNVYKDKKKKVTR